SVPATNPSCTASVSHAVADVLRCHSFATCGATADIPNQRDMPRSKAKERRTSAVQRLMIGADYESLNAHAETIRLAHPDHRRLRAPAVEHESSAHEAEIRSERRGGCRRDDADAGRN